MNYQDCFIDESYEELTDLSEDIFIKNLAVIGSVTEGTLLVVSTNGMVRPAISTDNSLKARIIRKIGQLFRNTRMEWYGKEQSFPIGYAIQDSSEETEEIEIRLF